MKNPVNRKAFTAWLEQQDDSEVLGVTHKLNACPISNYVIKTNPSLRRVCTTYSWIAVETDSPQEQLYDNPPWLTNLILEIDELRHDPGKEYIVPVTAGQLKEILRQIPQGEIE